MVSTSAPSFFHLQTFFAIARPKTRKFPSQNPKPNLKTKISTGIDATTDIRLPPKDNSITSFDICPIEIKLSYCPTLAPKILEREGSLAISKASFSDSDYDNDDDDKGIALEHGDVETIFNSYDFTEDDEEAKEDEEEKEKGVSAIMHYFDRAKIYVKASDSGNGVVAFHREKYVLLGGPSNRDDGQGGNVCGGERVNEFVTSVQE